MGDSFLVGFESQLGRLASYATASRSDKVMS